MTTVQTETNKRPGRPVGSKNKEKTAVAAPTAVDGNALLLEALHSLKAEFAAFKAERITQTPAPAPVIVEMPARATKSIAPLPKGETVLPWHVAKGGTKNKVGVHYPNRTGTGYAFASIAQLRLMADVLDGARARTLIDF